MAGLCGSLEQVLREVSGGFPFSYSDAIIIFNPGEQELQPRKN
jgi:hypothetical protein